MSRPTPLLAALALAAVLIPAAALHAGRPAASAALPTVAPVSARAALSVEDAHLIAVPPGATETSALMILRNAGGGPVVLTGVSTPLADHAMLMTTRRDAQGRTGMSAVKTLTVPARGSLRLTPTGDHLMLMGLTRPLRVGETVALTLSVQGGRPLSVNAVVRRP